MGEEVGSTAAPINSSNLGFQLLKKHGWTEGTGLGLSQQGMLEPVQAYLKTNKRGLGADHQLKKKTSTSEPPHTPPSTNQHHKEHSPFRKSKPLTKKQRKKQELEKRLQEKEFERAFCREFWPDNV